MLLQRRAHLRARAVEKHSLVCLGEVQSVAGLLGVPSEEIAQRDDLTLAWWQVADGAQHDVAGLLGLELALGLLPRGGRARPPSGALAAATLEAIGVQSGPSALLVAAAEQREGQDAPLASAPGACLVQRNARDPGAERGAALEA